MAEFPRVETTPDEHAERSTLPDGVTVRPADPEELPAVMGVLDGALLAIDAAVVRARIERESVLVAVADERVLGALVREDDEIAAIAVRRARRDQGIATGLVETADAATEGVLSARFRTELRPFYESLGFSIRPDEEPGRLVGRRE